MKRIGKGQNVTNAVLYGYYKEIEQMQSSVMYQLLFGKIKDFGKINGGRINTIIKTQNEINQKYFEYNQDGSVVMIKEEGKPDEPKLKEGMVKEDYVKEFDSYMAEETYIEW